MKKLVIVCFIIIGFVLVGCQKVKPTITIQDADKDITINIGEERQVTAAVHKKFIVEWVSENPSIATVDNGKIKGLSIGTTKVLVKIKNEDVSIEIKVTVNYSNPASITIMGKDTVIIGTSVKFNADVSPTTADQKVEWQTSDASIASIDSSGVVTGLKSGTVTISAYSVSNRNISNTKIITVVLPTPEKIIIIGKDELIITDEEIYSIVQTPDNAQSQVIWSVNDESIATINENGKLKALKPGKVTILAKAISDNTIQAMKIVNIYDLPISISIDEPREIKVDEKFKLNYTITPITASQSVDWESSDPTIAKIDNKGFVTGIKAGTVTITGYATFDHSIKTEIIVTVILKDPTSLQIDGPNTVCIGDEITYSIITTPVDANKKVEWWVSDYTVATIDENGKLTAINTGYITISARSVNGIIIMKSVRVRLVDPTEISIIGPENVNMNQSYRYTVSVMPKEATSQVYWSVSDRSMAFIDQNGNFVGYKGGQVTITATCVENSSIKKDLVVTIYDEPREIIYYGPDVFVVGGTGKVYGKVIGEYLLPTDPNQLVYSVNDSSIITIDQNGKVTAKNPGKCKITIKSSLKSNVYVVKEITVYQNFEYQLDEIIVNSKYQDQESFYSDYDQKTHIIGYDAFNSIDKAINKAKIGSKIIVQEGTYNDEVKIDKNNITIYAFGNVINTGIILINKGIKGLTIDGLSFTGTGCVIGSPEGGIENFTFRNNHVYDSNPESLSALSFFVDNDDSFNSNFLISNNIFEVVNLKTLDSRYLRCGNINNLTIIGNTFKGLKGQYTDAIRLGGTGIDSEGTEGGSGVSGKLIIKDNQFINIGERAIWIRYFTASHIIIEDNLFDNIGDENLGGAIQIQGYSALATDITIRFNTFKNIKALYGVRLNNINVDDNYKAFVNYNRFEEFNHIAKYIEGYSDDNLIDGENNYYDVLREELVSKVKNFAVAYDNLLDYQVGVATCKNEDPYGIKVYEEDFENHFKISYSDTYAKFGKLEWKIKDVSLNPDNDDLNSATDRHGKGMLRMRGENNSYMELTSYYEGITILVFDAKFYNLENQNARLKISKMINDVWIEVKSVLLTTVYKTYYVNINETDQVKIRFDATGNSVNVDNVRFYQSINTATKEKNLATVKQNITEFLGDKTGEFPGNYVGSDMDTYLRNHGNSGYTITHGNKVLFIAYKAYIELRAMNDDEDLLPWHVLQPHNTNGYALSNYGLTLSGPVSGALSVYGTGAMYHNGNDSAVILNSKMIYGYQGTAWGFTNYYGLILVNKDGLIKKNFSGDDLESGINITLESGDYLISNYLADRFALGNVGYYAHRDFIEGKTILINYNPDLVYKG